MNWLYYLLEANLYLVIFYGFYRIFLHRETFYQLNRYYLISSPVLAFLLPVFQIGYLDSLFNPVQNQSPVMIQYSGELLPAAASAPALAADDTIFVCYLLVAAFFLFRLSISLYGIFRMAVRADKTRKDGVIQVHITQPNTAFSFLNLLFINPGTDKQNIILQHEMIHVRQKHSLDILFFEMLLICNWFNPFCWLMKQDIKLVHEYIADEATTKQGLVKYDYALFLIRNSFGSFPNTLTSQMFNQSILKNRISMLNKKRSAGRARLRLLYVLPLTGGMLCSSTLGFTKDYATVDLYAKKIPSVSRIVFQEPKQEKKNNFVIESTYDAETGGTHPIKLILINGKVSNAKNVIAVYGFDKVAELNSTQSIAKYGKRAAGGALEFTGKTTRLSVRFPPPLPVKNPPEAPAAAPPAPQLPANSKSARIKFPPPAPPKPDKTAKKITFPPPARPKPKNVVVKFPPPAAKPALPASPKAAGEDKQVKFPPPIVKPMTKYTGRSGAEVQEKLDVGPNPMYINNGNITMVNPGQGKIVKFTAKSVRVQSKNNDAAIKKYGEAARDGVIELEDGEFSYAEPEPSKKE